MNKFLYWGIVGLISFVHLMNQQIPLSLPFQIVLSAGIATIIPAILSTVIHYNIDKLNIKINGSFFIVQFIILTLYLSATSHWIVIILFIVIEGLRHFIANNEVHTKLTLNQYEKELELANETFKKVRSERHDFLKHIAAIHFMLEKQQFQEAKTYLDDLVGTYEESNMSIKGETGVVAGILNSSYRKAKKLGISAHYDLDNPISSLPMDDQEIVALVGNLLSNSIDACEEWQNERREQAYLSVEFYKRSGLYILTCTNDTMPIPTDVLDHLFQSFGHTTKLGNHEGLGTKIIYDIVKKYDGYLDFKYKNEKFTVVIKIPALL